MVEIEDFLVLRRDDDLALMHLTWLRPISSPEFREGAMVAIKEAQNFKCRLWLNDTRESQFLEKADQDWLIKVFTPEVFNSAIQRLARVASLQSLPVSISHNIIDRVKQEADRLKRPLEFEIFYEIETALFWLGI